MSDYFDDAAGEAEEGEAEGNELPADPDDDDPGDNIEHSDGAEDQEEGGNQVRLATAQLAGVQAFKVANIFCSAIRFNYFQQDQGISVKVDFLHLTATGLI